MAQVNWYQHDQAKRAQVPILQWNACGSCIHDSLDLLSMATCSSVKKLVADRMLMLDLALFNSYFCQTIYVTDNWLSWCLHNDTSYEYGALAFVFTKEMQRLRLFAEVNYMHVEWECVCLESTQSSAQCDVQMQLCIDRRWSRAFFARTNAKVRL